MKANNQKKKLFTIFYKKLSLWKDPEAVFSALFSSSPYSFWLDSSKAEELVGRFSYMGDAEGPHSEILTYSLKTNHVTIQTRQQTVTQETDMFSYLKVQLHSRYHKGPLLPFDFIGGYVGYFGYEMKHVLGYPATHHSLYPDAFFLFADRVIVFDHVTKSMYLVCYSDQEQEADAWFASVTQKIRTIPNTKKTVLTGKLPHSFLDMRTSRSRDQYIDDISLCKTYLTSGDSYQLCLTQNIHVSTPDTNWFVLYTRLRKVNPAPFATFFNCRDFAILSSSPEKFLSLNKRGVVESKPIKGTIKRSKNENIDKQLMNKLLKSNKNKAENMMIVDLIRNDLGKVCQLGTITVPKLCAIESYKTVHHLVSTIHGQVKQHITPIDVIKATFPGGSMTGAPKKRAMEILDTIEQEPRGIYAGTLGFLSLNSTMEFSIVIRTLVCEKNNTRIGVGGAILLKSDAHAEYKESMLKGKVLIDVLKKTLEKK